MKGLKLSTNLIILKRDIPDNVIIYLPSSVSEKLHILPAQPISYKLSSFDSVEDCFVCNIPIKRDELCNASSNIAKYFGSNICKGNLEFGSNNAPGKGKMGNEFGRSRIFFIIPI